MTTPTVSVEKTTNFEKNETDWLLHQNFVLVHLSDGNGQRHIGNAIEDYTRGDLIFLGPRLPFLYSESTESTQNEMTIVRIREGFPGNTFLELPELSAIHRLFDAANSGIVFSKDVQQRVGDRLYVLDQLNPFSRILALLDILHIMADDQQAISLNAAGINKETNPLDNLRMGAIYTFIQANFRYPIRLEALATEINMTPPSFCRYFKKITKKTPTRFINEFRVTYASKLLTERDMSITEVCFESGFYNVSHFNKQFKLITGKTPREFRKAVPPSS